VEFKEPLLLLLHSISSVASSLAKVDGLILLSDFSSVHELPLTLKEVSTKCATWSSNCAVFVADVTEDLSVTVADGLSWLSAYIAEQFDNPTF